MRSRKGMSLSYVVPRSIKGIEVRFHIAHMRKRKGDLCLVWSLHLFLLPAHEKLVCHSGCTSGCLVPRTETSGCSVHVMKQRKLDVLYL